MNTDPTLDELREAAQLPIETSFDGMMLAPFTAGYRALYRGLARKYPDLSGSMLSWALVYLLTLPPKEAILEFKDPDIALHKAFAFAEYHSRQEDEVLRIATTIFEQVDSAVVIPNSSSEADPKV